MPAPLSLRPFILAILFFACPFFSSYSQAKVLSPDTSEVGDVNLDGSVNFQDISPFLSLLTAGTYQFEADTDGNGAVNFFDISPFIILLSSQHEPEPINLLNSRPNVVMVVVDDLGYGDFDVDHMPLTSALIQSRGTRLNLYGHQNCVPSRAALLTGMSPVRFNQHSVFPLPLNGGVPARVPLLSEFLQDSGYQTAAFGKWHLGFGADQVPTLRGFDKFVGLRGGQFRSYGTLPGGVPYPDGTLGHDHHTRHDLAENGTSFYTSQFSTHLFRDKAVEYIESVDSSDPFFAYISFNAPHSPYHAPRAAFDAVKLEHGITPADEAYLFTFADDVVGLPFGTDAPEDVQDRINKAVYYAMVKDVDEAIAEVWDSIVDSGHADDTMFLFTSDNGGVTNFADNGIFRAGKGTAYEGGVFVANGIIAPWIEPGQKINTDIWMADLTPTVLQLAGVNYTGLGLDGATAIKAMTENAEVVRKTGLTSFPCHVNKRFRPSLNVIQASASVHGSNFKYIRFYTIDLDGTTILDTAEAFYDLSLNPSEIRSSHQDPAYAEIIEQMRTEHDFWIGEDRIKGINTVIIRDAFLGYIYPDEWGDY